MTYFSWLAAPLALAPAFTTSSPLTDVRPWEHQTSDIPVDPRIHFGALKNGLRFAWMDNSEPKKRCYLRLHVDVGSLAEEDSERGMAHFLEHMAFNGSKRFPAGTLVEWFQRHGMSFGADSNATTDFSQTVYQLDLPVSGEKTIEESLQVLRDFADGLTLEQKDIDAERGVIDGEERERETVKLRLFKEMLRLQLSGTRIADRMPLGIKATRDKFDAAALRKFYSTWYRPDNMTLLLVGDLQGRSPEALIEKEFASLQLPGTPRRAEPSAGKPDMAHPVYAICEAEMPVATLAIQMAKPFRDRPATKAAFAELLPLSVAASMINLRFMEMGKHPDTTFGSARLVDFRSSMEENGIRVQEGLVLTFTSKPATIPAALLTCEQELRRALEFGFEARELDAARADILRSLDDEVARDKTRSSTMCLQKLLDATERRFIPVEASTRRGLIKPIVEALDVEACRQALVKEWSEGELVIGFSGPLKLGADEAKFQELLKEVYEQSRAEKVEARTKTEDKPFAYTSDASKAGEISSRSYNEEFEFHDVSLANGVRVHIKKTDFKQKEIVVSVQIGEGRLSLDPSRRSLIRAASHILTAGGLEKHTADELRRMNAGKQVDYSFEVRDDQFEMEGETTREDLLREFELMCAHLTHPGWHAEDLDQFYRQVFWKIETQKHEHGGPIYSQFLPAIYSGDLRRAWITQADFKAVEMSAVSSWLEPQFADGPIDVVLVGDLDVDEAIAAAAHTFGTLAKRRATDRHEDRRQPITLKTGLHEKYSVDTTLPKTLVYMVFPATDGRETATRRNLKFLGTVLNDRLRTEVRERLGAAYWPTASVDLNEVTPGDGMIVVNAMSDPDKVDALVEACSSTVEKLATDGVTQEEVDRLRAPILAGIRDDLRTNEHWTAALSRIHTSPTILEEFRSEAAFFETVQPDALTRLAKTYLKRERANIAIVAPAAVNKDAQSIDSAAPKKKD